MKVTLQFIRIVVISLFVIGKAFAQAPTQNPTGFIVSAFDETSLTVSWTNVGDGNRTHYLILANTTGTFTDPTNGGAITDDTNLADGSAAVNIAGGNTSQQFTGLNNATLYYFKIFAVNNNGDPGDPLYLTSSAPTTSRTTVAAFPSGQPSSMVFSNRDANSMTVSWTAASGPPAGYFVLRRAGSAPTGNPSDGQVYSVGDAIGDGVVAFVGNAVTFDDAGLSPTTTYHYKVHSYNGANATINYLNGTTPLAGSEQTTAVEPTTQAKDIVFSAFGETTITLTWTNGNGDERLVVGKAMSAVDFTPVDGTGYLGDANFSTATDLGGGNKSLYRGNGNSVVVTNLSPGTVYHFRIFERLGTNLQSNYLLAASSDNPASAATTAAQPTVQATGLVFSNITNTSVDVSWTNGTGGNNRLLVVRQGSNPVDPSDRNTYTANAAFGSGSTTGTGSFVVYKGSGTSATVTGLTAGTSYAFKVYEFNSVAGGDENYRTDNGAANNPLSVTTASEPANHVTGLTASASSSVITLNWTGATGSPAPTNYLLLGRNITASGSHKAYGDGTAIPSNDDNLTSTNNGSHAIPFGTNTFNGWSGLVAGNGYEFLVISYRSGGTPDPDLKLDGTVPTVTVYVEPSASSTPTFSNRTPTSVDVTIPSATGASGFVVIRKQGSAPGATPSDNTAYTAGTTIAAGETVVYSGPAGTFTDGSLLSSTTYHYAVYSYSGSGTLTNYRSTAGTASTSTLCAPPSTQASNITFGTTLAGSVVVNWTRGDGDNVLVLAREVDGNPNTVTPTNGTTYTANASFGDGDNLSITGNDYYTVYNGPLSTVTVTGLDANTQYNFKAFEYNNTNVCFNTSTPASANVTTPSVSSNTTLNTGTGFSSLPTTAIAAGSRVDVFRFTVTDIGDDGSDTDISQMIFTQLGSPSNQIVDWTELIAGAVLSATSSSQNGQTVTINPTNITISNIDRDVDTGNGELGEVRNGNSKTYTLAIWFKTSLGGDDQPNLAQIVDGLKVGMQLTSANITTDASGSSFFASSQVVTSNDNGSNGTISVVATAIRVTQQPSTTATQTVALAQQPIFEAVDAQNNRDLGFNFALAVSTTNPANLGGASAPGSFSNGVADFTSSGFNFTNTGSSTMRVTANAISSSNTSSVTVVAATNIAALTSGIASDPLNSSATNQALLGFSATTTSGSLNFTGLQIPMSSTAVGKLSNIRLYRSTTNNYTTGTLTQVATAPVSTSPLVFTAFTEAISSTPTFYFVVADVEPLVSSSTPQLLLTLTPSTSVTVSSGAALGSAISSPNYQFNDVTPATIVSVTNSVNPIFGGSLTQTVTVVFNEPMSNSAQPVITLSGSNWGPQTPVGADGWANATTYVATFTHNGTQETITNATASIVSPSGAKDLSGNDDTGGGSSTSFVIDTRRPTSTISVSTDPIRSGALTQTVTVRYSESMNTSTAPAISFGTSTHFSPSNAGAWSTTTFTNDTWTRAFTHDGTEETINHETVVVANAGGAKDTRGNDEVGSSYLDFLIDTRAPRIQEINSPAGNGTYTTGQSMTIEVRFDEQIVVSGSPTITLSSGGTGTLINISPTRIRFNYTIQAGENATDLDVTSVNLNGGTIRDVSQNNAVLSAPGPTSVLSFFRNINIDTQAPFVVSVSSSVADGAYKAGAVIPIDVVFNEPVTLLGGVPNLSLNTSTSVSYVSGSGTNTLTFDYTVSNGQNVSDLDYLNTASLQIPGLATLRDEVGQNAVLTLPAPGAANSLGANKNIVIDTTIPTITSVAISSPTNAWSTTNGISTTSADFLITFSEPVTGFDLADITPYTSGSATYGSITILGAGNTRTVRFNDIAGPGRLSLSINAGSIFDAAANAVANPFNTTVSGSNYYSVALPEAAAPVATFVVQSTTTTSLTVAWTPAATSPLPNYYYVQLKLSTIPSFGPVSDGSLAPTDSNPADGTYAVYVAHTGLPQNWIISNLTSGASYDIRITPLSYNGSLITNDNSDYRTADAPVISGSTPTGNTSTLTFSNESVTLSSLADTPAEGQDVFEFTITDDGAVPTTDNAPFKFDNLTITPGAGNDIAWTQAIAGAQLVSGAVVLNATSITDNTIVFSSIPSAASSDLGFVSDNAAKNFALRIWLKSSLGGTLPADIDGLNFGFLVNNGSLAYNNGSNNQASSTLAASQMAENTSNAIAVDVQATTFAFRTPGTPGTATQPPAQIGVGTNFPSPNQPVIYVLDANNNLDKDFNSPIAISNTGGLTQQHGHNVFPTGGSLVLNNYSLTQPGTTAIRVQSIGLPILASAISSSFQVNLSNKTQITPSAALTEPDEISSLATSLATAVPVFDFTVSDDVGADAINFTDNDGLPTLLSTITITQGNDNNANLSDWTNAIAGAELSDGTNTFAGLINATNITFTTLPTSTGQIGYIADDGSKTYTLRVYLRSNVANIADVIDNKHFEFAVADVSVSPLLSAQSSIMAPGSAESGTTKNKVDVDATQLDFTTSPATTQSYDAPITPTPQVKARDVNGNVDLDYAGSPTLTTVSPSTYPAINTTLTNSNGTISFQSSLTVTSAGNGAAGDQTSFIVSDGTLNDATSVLMTFNYSTGSDIIRNTSFTYPQNISYIQHQATDITNANSVVMEQFTVRDGGASNDADGSPTVLNDITLRVSNHSLIRRIAIYDGATELAEAGSANFNSSGDVRFTGFLLTAADNSTKTFSVKASFLDTNITDHSVITFDVISNSARNTASSQFANALPSGITSNVSGDENKIQVIATRIDFITPSVANDASLNSPYSALVHARDIKANLDVDFTGTGSEVRALTNQSSASMANAPVIGTTTFTAGVLSFPVNFQFTSGNDNDNVTLSIKAGTGTTCGVDAICGQSPQITLRSSFESTLEVDPTFVQPADIRYINYQATDVTLIESAADPANSSTAIAQFILYDKSLDADNNGIRDDDNDGAPTNIKDLTFSISNHSNLRKVALYIGSTEIQEKPAAASVTFNNLSSLVSAPDNGSVTLTIRASFNNTATDNQMIQLAVTNVTQDGGSQFVNTITNPIGGIAGGAITSPNVKIEVLATQLVFTTQPPAFAGISQPFTTAVVEARDANGMLDVDQSNSGDAPADGDISATSAGVGLLTLPFTNGVMTFGGFEYTSPGDGTLTVGTDNQDGVQITGTSNHVDVLHITTAAATSGVYTGSLGGGAQKRVIFGVTFEAPYVAAAEPNLDKFTISFSTTGTITGVFSNIKVFQSEDDIFDPLLDTDVTSLGAVITPASRSILIDFNGGAGGELAANGGRLTYFLMVDVENSANSLTPAVRPVLLDEGFGQLTETNIVATEGSQFSNVQGNLYDFAAINAPTIVSSYPATGQINVDPTQPTIEFVYTVPVFTLDEKIRLYDYETNALVQELPALNGKYSLGTVAGTETTPLTFQLPTLQADHLYYITIPPGKFNGPTATNNVGIMDESKIVSPGFSYPGTLYFKTAKAIAPKLLTTPAAPKAPTVTNISLTGATINAIFDQPGTAHFMVVPFNAPAPTNAQIRNEVTYAGTVVNRGSFTISQTNTITTFGMIYASLTANTTYDVYICAESYSSKNKVLTPIRTAAPFGGSSTLFAEGTAGPTLRFTTPATTTTAIKVFKPTLQICANSYQTMNSPIVLVEGTNSDFFTGPSSKNFNILLPSGFQFDVTKDAITGLPLYGKLELKGADFNGNTGSLSYINNSILRVTFTNNGTSSLDNITISGLRIIGNSSAGGKMIRLGGDAITGLPDNTEFGSLSANDATPIDFTNAYNEYYYPGRRPAITFIPDNFNVAGSTVQLIPLPKAGDYGPSSFNGAGVTIDQLSLGAVTLGSPFNITVTHTDNNGCISQNPVQYTVYDHTQAITGLGTQYCATNANYPANATVGSQVYPIRFDANTSRNMRTLAASIPAGLTQIISGTEWQKIIAKLPVKTDSIVDPNNGSKYFRNYSIDLSDILNATTIPNPYLNFRKRSPDQLNTYYTGGLLGIVEFTGEFQSRSNLNLEFPLKQNVGFYLPAVPIVEVKLANRVSLDVNDPLNPVPPTPVDADVLWSNKGTSIFCVDGGPILIQGYPSAIDASEFTGTFRLEDAANPSIVIYSGTGLPPTGLQVNSDGSASLDPSVVAMRNGYRDIRIIYTYKAKGSPCESSGQLIIRIAPNPVANFTFTSIVGPNIETTNSYCADRPVLFDASSSQLTTGSIDFYKWNFNDAANSNQLTNPNEPSGDAAVARSVTHQFKAASYGVTLSVKSADGCWSGQTTKTVNVGAIPVTDFTFTGVSTADQIQFENTSTIGGSATLGFKNLVWNFGDNAKDSTTNPATVISHQYQDPKIYKVKLKVVSTLGCVNTLTKKVGIVPQVTLLDDQAAYVEDFQSSNGGYQVLPNIGTDSSSWQWGNPQGVAINSTDAATRVWTTALQGAFLPRENSSLYSPSFNIIDLMRPIVTFKGFTHLGTSDGVVVEYSTDNYNITDTRKVWTTLGTGGVNPSGVNWYNDGGTSITAKPGQQETGFGRTGRQTDWVDSKHALASIPKTDRAKVVFRFTIASVNSDPAAEALDGFAVDEVRVGNATRTVLIENFTNTASEDPAVPRVNNYIKNFKDANQVGSELVKINYHVAFPGSDPFNADNQADPGARALYYNISTVPQTRMDGRFEGETGANFDVWGGTAFDRQVLNLANAAINVETNIVNGELVVSGYFIPYFDINESTLLNLAVVEETIPLNMNSIGGRINTNETEFEYVLKRMLPSAAGLKYPNPETPVIHRGDTVRFGPYTINNITMFMPANDLAIVAFLQDENSTTPQKARTVYQSIIKRGVQDPSIVTDIEDMNETFSVYPSPADREMVVELPQAFNKSSDLQMYDQLGKVVAQYSFERGVTSRTVDTSNMPAGVYLIQVKTEKGILRRKVMVLHKQ